VPGNAAVVADVTEEGMSCFEARMSVMGDTVLRKEFAAICQALFGLGNDRE
jgi:hypothetical protein